MCPSRLARKATIASAIPVISMSRPRKTNSGTARRISVLIPSSIREMTTVSGVLVVVAR